MANQIDKLIGRFSDEMRKLGWSGHTRRAYERGLHFFVRWLTGEMNVESIDDVTSEMVAAWREELGRWNVLAELRILASTDFDSRAILTVVFAGDGRLAEAFRRDNMLPIASRIRVRSSLDYLTPKELLDWLRHVLEQAGNPHLMAPELMTSLTEHAAGNLRVLSIMASELLALAARREISQLDQKLYLETYAQQPRAWGRSQEPRAARG